MLRVIRHAKLLLCVASVLALSVSSARAASVVWTIDSTATTMGLSGTGQAPLSGAVAKLKVIQQGVTPIGSVTPVIPVKVSGTFVTNTDFTSSITFLKSALVEGEPTGTYSPDMTGGVGTSAPGDIGTSIVGKLGALNLGTVADGVLREMRYDISGPAAAISGGSFPVTGLTVSIIQGRLDYRGTGVGEEPLGSGTTNVTDPLIPGDATYDHIVDGADYTVWANNFLGAGPYGIYSGDFTGDNKVDGADYTIWANNFLQSEDPFPSALNTAGNATISITGSTAKLTMPVKVTLQQILDEGDTSTATDDIVIDLNFTATVIAYATIPSLSAPVPEPSTLALSAVAGLGMCAVGIRRKLRRKSLKS